MGEYADYILNGDDCQSCGMHIGTGHGYPRNCKGCETREKAATKPKTFECPRCFRKFGSEQAKGQHFRDFHDRPTKRTTDHGERT